MTAHEREEAAELVGSEKWMLAFEREPLAGGSYDCMYGQLKKRTVRRMTRGLVEMKDRMNAR